ncbi:helix-turn-helix transcriptional regulator [Paenibacillus sp. FSL R5-0517]|uniref:helix-turn-helix transcriptional regulator n=1 Tax=Paenibacillus sp. FSL R5-0517 TaxID=2921647 RepID=UPI0030D9D43C
MNEETRIELRIPPLPHYLGCGRTEYAQGEKHPHRSNIEAYDMLIMIHGEMYIGENGSSWTLTDGDLLLLLPDAEHYSVKPCEKNTAFYWIHFEHSTQNNFVSSEKMQDHLSRPSNRPFSNSYTLQIPKYMRLPDTKRVFKMLEELLAHPSVLSFWQEQQLLGELLGLIEEMSFEKKDSATSKIAERTVMFLQENYKDKITNTVIASALHFHPNYIVRCMQERYNCTPLDYLLQYRLERAKRLLVSNDWSIERVSEEVGFRHSPYFSACFKKEFGTSPLQFRKLYLK